MAKTEAAVRASAQLDAEIEGLDHLEFLGERATGRGHKFWAATWPKLLAVGIVFGAWQFLVWREWRPRYVLAAPSDVLSALWNNLLHGNLLRSVGVTMQRAAIGFLLATLIGGAIGLAVVRVRPLRAAVGSLITGLQTMPSIAWFPLAILLFGLNETAILFVVVLGAAPAIANGLISGIDHVPPLLLRAGRVLGARGISAYRHVILPAALPSAVAGLKQGWAFAWRSLMAGELLVIVVGQTGIGARLQFARELSDAPGLMATMIAILVLGILVDIVLFGLAERSIRERRGLVEATA
jgi:NitT/TauT family transport system permease protein